MAVSCLVYNWCAMSDILFKFARKFRPDLDKLSGQQRLGGVADVVSLVFSLPLLAVGLVWLARLSNWEAARQQWAFLILMAVLIIAFNRLSFYVVTEIRAGGYANSQGALDGLALWGAALMVGPVAIWLDVLWNLGNFINNLRTSRTVAATWSQLRQAITTVASSVLSTLVGLEVYFILGGEIPIHGLEIRQFTAALVGIMAQLGVTILVHGGYIGYVIWALKRVMQTPIRWVVQFFGLALALPSLANPFGILMAGLYVEGGVGVLIFLMIGLLLVALLARRLSRAAEVSRQQSRQLEELEKLGRAIINAPPDASTLPEILKTHVPLMFATRGIAIWTKERGLLLHEPVDWETSIEPIWKWLQRYRETKAFLAEESLPWQPKPAPHEPLLIAPILNGISGETEGCVYLELQTLAVPWDVRSVASLLPAVQSLSAQVASACHQAHIYAEMLAGQKMGQELALARRIQESFLPEHIPQLPGWHIAAALEPARQMAGDFYDFIELPEGRLGILIADVADKGLGPAMYMALSRTLIRTYARQFPQQPAQVFATVNQRILQDARANLFVTVFYGVLDPAVGLLTYANAGHTPPYLVNSTTGIQTLRNTGMPLGIDEESVWSQETVVLNSGDVLLLYTDGVTDAQNSQGEFIDRKSILDIASDCPGKPVEQIRRDILEVVHEFIGEAPRFDDITLVILVRD
jgi:serine phosphatase RsbU (regulator of sigma subunit)